MVDEEPKIFRDELALRLSGSADAAALQAQLQGMQAEVATRSNPELAQTLLRFLRTIMTVRARYVEDELEAAIQRGVDQYVILGAGLDSFAYRRGDLTETLQVFEIDHPATQAWKRERLQTLNIAVPPNLTFVPLDFELQTLTEGLQAGGFKSAQPALFSWLGVVMYLTEEAVLGTLKEMVSFAPGTTIVFEYMVPDTMLKEEERQVLAANRAATGGRGEPQRSAFDPGMLTQRVKELGFSTVIDYPPEEANRRYCTGRTDGLSLPQWVHFIQARV